MRTKEEILQGMEESLFIDICSLDFRFWAERVFGAEPKDFHIEWMDLVHNNRYVMLQAARGFGKTYFLGVIYPIWLAYYHPKYKLFFTASELGQATKILDEVKGTIEDNEFLEHLMPTDPKSTWRKTELKLTNGAHFLCKAFTVHMKGIHVNYVFVDEIQDIIDRNIFYKAISPTVNRFNGHLIAVGVPDNPGDMVEELSNNEEYVNGYYPALVLDKHNKPIPNNPLYPEVFPMEKLNQIRKRDGESSFQTQYMLNPRAEGDNDVFPHNWIANCYNYQERFHDTVSEDGFCFIGADFAISQGKRADYDCYVVVQKFGGRTYIRYAERHKGTSVDSKVLRLKELFAIYNPLKMILDPSNVGIVVVQDLRNLGFPVEEGEFHSRARHKLLVNLQMMMQPDKNGNSELVIPRNAEDSAALTFSNKLVEELIGFKEERSIASGIKSYVSKAAHDDTVAALALAVKGASEQCEFLDMVGI